MKFILLLITTFGYCFGYSQKRQEYKLINAVLANGNGVLTRKAHILDTMESINDYYNFTVRDLLIAQKDFKYERKGVLFSKYLTLIFI